MTERITAAEFQASQTPETQNKYGAEKVIVQGIKFDSKREAARWAELRALEMAGEIADLKRQITVHLQGAEGPVRTASGRVMRYIADFAYTDLSTGLTVYEDAKGHATKEYLVKAGVVRAMGLDLREV